MAPVRAEFGSLSRLAGRMQAVNEDIGQTLDDLAGQLRRLDDEWAGAAADGFQHTLRNWHAAANDLRNRLAMLTDLVNTANANYHTTVATNVRMWPTR